MLLDQVIALLDGAGIRYRRDSLPGAPLVHVPWQGRAGQYEAVLEAWDEARRLKVFIYLPGSVPPEGRAAVAQLLMRVNWSMSFGSFELDFDSGLVRYRAATAIPGGKLDAPTLSLLVEGSLLVADAHTVAVRAVASGAQTVDAAYARAQQLMEKTAR